jgi:PAS domain-containing protein
MKEMDMSDRRDLPDDVSHSISTLRAMVEECPLAMVALDRDDRVQMWNQAAERMFGWKEESLGRPLPVAQGLLEAQLHSGSGQAADLTWPCKDESRCMSAFR